MNNRVMYHPDPKMLKCEHNNFLNLSDLPPSIINLIDRNSLNLIGLWDTNDQLLFVSQSVEKLLGYKGSELLGYEWKRRLCNEQLLHFISQFDKETSESYFHLTIMDYKDSSIDFKTTLKRIKDEKDGTAYFIGFFEKILNQSKAEEIIAQSEKMCVAGQLAAGIAHEIRNPLTSLKGFLQLLQSGIEQKDIYYQIMNEEIEKIEMITSELLYISKPLTDEKKLESIYSMVNDVTILLGSQARLKNIRIEHSICEELYIYCNRSQIKQVFINIIKNAIEAMEKKGTIKIVTRLTENRIIEIDIIDEGPGIPQHILDKVGEPFFTTKESGTGLGLMITKQILEKQFGNLKIVESSDKGSIFRISFPEP